MFAMAGASILSRIRMEKMANHVTCKRVLLQSGVSSLRIRVRMLYWMVLSLRLNLQVAVIVERNYIKAKHRDRQLLTLLGGLSTCGLFWAYEHGR